MAMNSANGDKYTNTSDPTTTSFRRKLNLSFKHRRRGFSYIFFTRIFHRKYLLFLAILYIIGLITCAGPLLTILNPPPPPKPGSLYHSHELFQKLWPEIQSDNSSTIQLSSLWRYKRKLKEQRACPNATAGWQPASPGLRNYLIVDANGGLNQQRSSICNAVALAGLLNATLVIPHFDLHSVWKDPSEFADIYDEDHFISSLKDFVTVVRNLPEELMESYDFNITNIPNIRVQAWAPARYYLDEVYPVLQEKRVVRISPFANRLAMSMPSHVQFLRCLTNYKALRFSSPILNLAKELVSRMTERSLNSGGKYVSVHLRFEEDMVAFSCCVYDGGEAEKLEMDLIREKGWGKKFKQKNRVIAPGLNRINGRCPMTPLEVGMMLRGMGFANDTLIYLASGKIYMEERYLAPLREMFPLLQTKESLASADELAAFQGYSSRLAALDYMVCLSSEVFVTTQGGNFPHFLMGHRRFIYNGHAKTIKPDKSKLVVLLQNTSASWDTFKDQMELMLAESDRKGIMVPRVKKSTRKTSIYSNPFPECRCLWESLNASTRADLYI
ncbi:O-fucosyltransferase family protein [Forsythia ovata]|uniref:O-fucosyltransferase family protein n=1 Tax=Forsythia ovata TaxID=205694 RepID=A0ABD1PUT4_9LAMI